MSKRDCIARRVAEWTAEREPRCTLADNRQNDRLPEGERWTFRVRIDGVHVGSLVLRATLPGWDWRPLPVDWDDASFDGSRRQLMACCEGVVREAEGDDVLEPDAFRDAVESAITEGDAAQMEAAARAEYEFEAAERRKAEAARRAAA